MHCSNNTICGIGSSKDFFVFGCYFNLNNFSPLANANYGVMFFPIHILLFAETLSLKSIGTIFLYLQFTVRTSRKHTFTGTRMITATRYTISPCRLWLQRTKLQIINLFIINANLVSFPHEKSWSDMDGDNGQVRIIVLVVQDTAIQ